MSVRIDRKELLTLTDPTKERNIYTHPFFLARDIFWQRLEHAFSYLRRYSTSQARVLDFGGGSGVFSKTLASYYKEVDVIDLDIQEAQAITTHYNIKNVNLICQDINTYTMEGSYDLIIATDVLEHFLDLNEPLRFFKKFLKHKGQLLVTLPTENWVYELGRWCINKTKPSDHYHTSKEVIQFLTSHGFTPINKRFSPSYMIPIPLFEVAIFTYDNL